MTNGSVKASAIRKDKIYRTYMKEQRSAGKRIFNLVNGKEK
jgi:hypothetical protein